MTEFIALDLETTGLSPEHDRIVEVGAVRFDASGRDLGEFHALVNPLRPVSPRARAIHGISDAELAAAPVAGVVLPAVPRLARRGLGRDPAGAQRLVRRGVPRRASSPGSGEARDDLRSSTRCPWAASSWPTRRTTGSKPWPSGSAWTPATPTAPWPTASASRASGSRLTGGVMPDGLVSYPMTGRSGGPAVPSGWETLSEAMAAGRRLRIAYDGGTRGLAPREITPRRFRHMGGVAYIVAECHTASRREDLPARSGGEVGGGLRRAESRRGMRDIPSLGSPYFLR